VTEQHTQNTGIVIATTPRPADRGAASQDRREWAVMRSGGSAVACRLVFAMPPPKSEREAA
jgi:hypothetical protein